MLSVPNRTTWENFFKQKLISNCNVKVYNLSGTLLFDKANMVSFSLKANNDYVCSNSPRTNCTIKLDLTSFVNRPVLAKGQWLTIYCVVEGIETTSGIDLFIDNIKISRQSTEATIDLIDFFTLQNQKQLITSYYIGNTIYDAIPVGAKSLPLNITRAEAFQQYTLFYNKGLKFKKQTELIPTLVPDYITYSTIAVGNYDVLNIHDDYEYETQDDNQTLQVFGIEAGTSGTIYNGTAGGGGSTLFKYTDFDKAYVVTSANVNGGGTAYRFSSGVAVYRNIAVGTYSMVIQGYEAIASEVPDGVEKYISTYTVETGSVEALAIQNYVRGYYANYKTISFKCRIDPTIEPLDVIEMNLEEGNTKIIVEEVGIDFNGGFTGSLKGRVVNELQSLSVSGMTTTFNKGDVFVFDGTVTAHTSYGDTSDVTSDCSFTGFDMDTAGVQTVTISYTLNGITVTTSYQITVLGVYDADPEIESARTDAPFEIDIVNRNDEDCELYIEYDGGNTVELVILANDTLTVNPTNAPELVAVASRKDDGILSDDVSCYFIGMISGNESNPVIIWNADY